MDILKNLWTKENIKLIGLSVVFWAPLIVFFKLAGEVLEREPIPTDIAILEWLNLHGNNFLDTFFLIVTNIGGIVGTILITASIIGYFLYKRRFKLASLVLASVGGATVANVILKALFHRDRPSLFRTSVVETSYSFPSGHAMASSALVLCLILMTWNTRWRWPVTIIGVIFVILVGISRPYFGVHYPSDIAAGWSASIGWVVLVFFATNRLKKLRLRQNDRADG